MRQSGCDDQRQQQRCLQRPDRPPGHGHGQRVHPRQGRRRQRAQPKNAGKDRPRKLHLGPGRRGDPRGYSVRPIRQRRGFRPATAESQGAAAHLEASRRRPGRRRDREQDRRAQRHGERRLHRLVPGRYLYPLRALHRASQCHDGAGGNRPDFHPRL